MLSSLSLKAFLCAFIAAAMLLSACAHPWRIAPEPSIDQDAVITTSEPTLDPNSTSGPDQTELPETDAPETDEPISSTPEATDSPEDTPAPTDTPAPSDTPQPGEATPEPTGTPVPTDTPAPGNVTSAPSATPTAAPTATPSPTPTQPPTPTPKPTPSPTPTPTPKPDNLPPFNAQSINGHGTITNSYYANARITMVNVWATTCGPCIQEMPHIEQLANNYANKGFRVLSVLGDSETPGCIQTALSVLNSVHFTQPVVRNHNGIPQCFPAGAYPTTYFIDDTGRVLKVVTASHTYEEWVSILNGLGIH